MFDTTALKERIDLLALAGGDLRKVASTRGGEYAGPCPRCGGQDRLHVQPEAGLFMCRQCHPAWGDAIEFVRWRDGLAFGEACKTLGGDPGGLAEKDRKIHIIAHPEKPRETHINQDAVPPSPTWQGRARAFAAYAQGELWQRPDALAYLHGRDLADETIKAAGLGYNPQDVRDKAEAWGLDGGPVWLAQGWVIPCEAGGVLWYVKVRRPGDAKPKYGQPRGGVAALFGGDTLAGHSDVVLCEGEFDALLLRQHVGAICGVATLASANKGPGPRDIAALGRARRLWLAYDSDAAGQAGAAKMGDLSARCRPLPWPDAGCKDVTDLAQAGHDLAAWVVASIGPSDLEARRAWAIRHLDALWNRAGDEGGPLWPLWQAILAAYEGLGPESGP